jgi:hypothetical protein
VNPLDPFSVPFVLSNDGNVSIHAVNYSCIFNFMKSERGLTFDGVEIGDERYIRARLYPSEKDTFRCLFAGNFAPPRVYLPIRRADITIKILYRPSFRFSQQSKYFRFVAQRSIDNQLYWFPQSLAFSEFSK